MPHAASSIMAVLGLDPRINPAISIGLLLNRIASFAKCVRVEDGRVKPGHDGMEELIFLDNLR
jgi:hypothetical protein